MPDRIERNDCGRLYRLTRRLSGPILAVRVVNHTPEVDDSFRELWLRVPSTMTTAQQIVAWTSICPPRIMIRSHSPETAERILPLHNL